MYEMFVSFVQIGGLIYFVLMFVGVLIYVLWLCNQEMFDVVVWLFLEDGGLFDE